MEQYVIPKIIDFDDLFARTPNTLVFNDIILDRNPEEIIDILCDISNEQYDSVASCQCGNLVGNYYTGIKCRICSSICESTLFSEIRNDSWLEIPPVIKGVLNPQVFRILSNWMGKVGKVSRLEMMLNMQLPIEPIPKTPFYSGMGFNWVYDNFETIINYFLTSKLFASKTASSIRPATIRLFLEKSGKAIWCTKLPILSKIIQPISKSSNTRRYADKDIANLIRSIFTMRSVLLTEKMMKFSTDHIDRNFYKIYDEFIKYTNTILFEKLPRKPSILRKHVFGSRSHCSCRSVAVPITEPHDSDEVYLPWKLGISVYKYHILSILTKKRGMIVLDAYNRIMNAINVYDHEIDLIMQSLIHDCPYKGLPILVNRNPSLRIASIQLLFVTKIKPSLKNNPFPQITDTSQSYISLRDDDEEMQSFSSILDEPELSYLDECTQIQQTVNTFVEDGTIEVSPCIVVGPNLDFDGDEINVIPLFEMDEVPKYMRLHPAHRFISNDDLAVQGSDVTLSSQQYTILSSWMNCKESC